MRKVTLALCCTLVASAAHAQSTPQATTLDALRTASDRTLQAGVDRVVRGLDLEPAVVTGRLALALVDLSDPSQPRLAMLNGDRMMYAASLPKIAILLGALVEAELGRLPLNERTVGAMTNMIRYSSNEDATRVLHWVGGERLIDILQSPRFRFYDVRGGGGLWVGKAYGKDAAYHRDPVAQLSHGATAYQVARFYTLLATDKLLSHPLNALMKETLSNPGIHHKFVKGLEGKPGARIYRKSGTWRDYHADSALVEAGRHRYVLVGIAQHRDGGQWLVKLAAPLHDLVVPARRDLLAQH
ncbi:MAG: serine hydrolase [Burkholderiales bacterium]|nr:serine hydrolase [Burkholderiales bacterium]